MLGGDKKVQLWSKCKNKAPSSSIPLARSGHSMTYYRLNSYFMFGGTMNGLSDPQIKKVLPSNELWLLDVGKAGFSWTKQSPKGELTKEENNLNIEKIAKLDEKVKLLEDKLKKSNQLNLDLKKQIKSNITNNINIRNNNTIQYLGNSSINQMHHSNNTLTEDTKDYNLTHGNETSNTKVMKNYKINRSNNNHKSNVSSDIINIRHKTPPASERKETIEMKRENLKTLLATSNKDDKSKTGFTNHSKLLMETINNIKKSNEQKSLQKQGKQYSKEIKSNSLNLNNYALLKSNYKNNNSNLKTETYNNIISKPVASSIANHKINHSNKLPINMKNMSTISSVIGKTTSLGSYNFNMTKDLQKSDNSALKSYICRLSDKKQLNSKNLKTIF